MQWKLGLMSVMSGSSPCLALFFTNLGHLMNKWLLIAGVNSALGVIYHHIRQHIIMCQR